MELPEHLSVPKSPSYRPLPAVLGVEGDWEGGAIVREFPSPLGVFLFGTFRDVMLWLLLPPGRRDEAFTDGARGFRERQLEAVELPPELAEPLKLFLQACSEGIDQSAVGTGCVAVAVWAYAAGALNTALCFRQAAALAHPDDAQLSLVTARLARDLGQIRRAETWFRRAIKTARLKKDWPTYSRGYLGLGAMYGRLGNGPAAKAVTERALSAARRWRLRQLAGEAHHDLLHIWAEARDLRRAYEHARSAEVHYRGAPKELCARLAGDIATIWLRVGAAGRALPIFESVIPIGNDLGLRAVWAAQLARCVALCGRNDQYPHVHSVALAAIAASPDPWRTAEAQVILAWADLAEGEWDRAASAAECAVSTAHEIGAAEILNYAVQALADARACRRAGALVDSLVETMTEPPALARVAETLAGVFLKAVASSENPRPLTYLDAGYPRRG
jgi:hypothetical protein